ncbi:MAG: rod-binding protein [Bdellovibrionaceae bacterium]|nr:rod-binding protein [Bdellovibrio sp.]
MSDIPKLGPALNPLNTGSMSEKKTKVTEEKFKEVAELYEKHFIGEMMKQMRSTVHEGGFIKKNNAEKIFSDQLDDQYVNQWSKAGGIGLAGLIHDQLMQKYGAQFGLKAAEQKPNGPIDLTSKSNYSGHVVKNASEQSNATTFKIEATDKSENPNQKVELRNPWVGTLLDKKYLEMERMQYHVKHDNGLESLIMTRGTGLGPDQQLSPGDRIQAGQQLGWANTSSPLFWTVKPNADDVSE